MAQGVRGGERLGRGEHILRSREFREIQRNGRRKAGRYVVLVVRRGKQTWTRMGLTVSRKVGGAVIRNRVKRRLREIFRNHKATLPTGLDVVMIARSASAQASYQSLEQEILSLFRKLHQPPQEAPPEG